LLHNRRFIDCISEKRLRVFRQLIHLHLLDTTFFPL
jgi:hypothetical protein